LLHFTVRGQPIPKARPVVANRRAFTPSKTVAWEQQVAWAARELMRDQPPLTDDLTVQLVFYRKGKRRADIDNLSKSILDAMNGIIFNDDRQIVQLTAAVFYRSTTPGVAVKITKDGS